MHGIIHRIEINDSPNKVYGALTRQKDISKWWTKWTNGDGKMGDVVEFGFNEGRFVTKMKVIDLERDRKVEWRCISGMPDWIDTRIKFHLSSKGNKTILRFSHKDWKEVNDFFAQCNTRWAYFLLSLKSYVENGKGTPVPDDLEF